MEILPLRLLASTDKPVFNSTILNLGLLTRSGLPVPPGIALSPLPLILATVLQHVQTREKDVFEQKLAIIKKELAKIPLPDELVKELEKQKSFYLRGEVYTSQKSLWLKMLSIWLSEIRSMIWREGLSQGATDHLSPLVVFFVSRPEAICTAYFDPDLCDVTIEQGAKLHPKTLQMIDKVVLAANKKLVISQIYSFIIIKDQPYLVGLKAFTQTRPVSNFEDVTISPKEQRKMVKSAVKVFLNLSSGFAVEKEVDGLIIEGEKVPDFDDRVFRLAEGALTFPDKPVLFKLPDENLDGLDGTNCLLHHQKLLGLAAKAVLFARNKKSLTNIDLAIPKIRSVQELNMLKKELIKLGITRKSNLNFWLAMEVPENYISVEKYIEEGIDGVIFSLDVLLALLLGYKPDDFYQNDVILSLGYQKEIRCLLDFLLPAIRALHQSKIPILVMGKLCLFPEVLDFLIAKGVYGMIVNNLIDAESMPDYLSLSERRVITRKLN